MASQVFSFTAESSDLSTFQVVDIDPSDSAYSQTSLGHTAIKVDVLSPMVPGNSIQIAIAWADCDTNKQNEIIGVSKYTVLDGTTTDRHNALDNGSGLHVATMTPCIVRTIGVGPCIDRRASPVSGIKRILLVGFVYADFSSSTATIVIVTPTKIV